MFLYPLLLDRYGKSTLKEYFLTYLDGAELDEIYRRFGFLGTLHRALFLDVWLPLDGRKQHVPGQVAA